MTLGEFAVTVGASRRWVQNARGVLGLRRGYTEEEARRLGLARTISEATGVPLRRAWHLAGEALDAWPAAREWAHEAPDGSVRLVIDLERYLSTHSVRLSLSRTQYAERRRGRRPSRPSDPLAAARAYGVDVDLLRESLKRTPGQRLRRLDRDVEFVRGLRVAEP